MMSLHSECIPQSCMKCNSSYFYLVVIVLRTTIAIFHYELRFHFSPGMLKSILSIIFHAKVGHVMISHIKKVNRWISAPVSGAT